MPNRLADESSPYLRQHAENPVDWYPWGPEAFQKAAAEGKPVFLSVGYSACHWCHVMAHESFEDAEIAKLLNDSFVSVKVDREERPDVDAIYMDAVQALTGHGGWPMSIFLTPDQVPFYGGTYFPPRAARGMPGFADVARQVATLWATKREDLLEAGDMLKEALLDEQLRGAEAGTDDELTADPLEFAQRNLTRAFDRVHGGWGGAPKFPQPVVLEFVMRRYVATRDENLLGMAKRTLDAMMRGGMYDQLGGGFHRYSTDARWLVPHFEKMLYDNAQLARAYLHGWQVTANAEYRRVVTETLDYAVREMLDPAGGFYSAQDADTEGEEGRFFVWTPEQVRQALEGTPAEDADLLLTAYGVTDHGNFEGATVLSMAQRPEELAETSGRSVNEVIALLQRGRDALLAAREGRERPARDDKVLAGWNGLMLIAFAEAARVLERDDYREVAERNASFLLERMRGPDGRMLRTWTGGEARLNGYLEDQAACAEGFLELYQATFDPKWFEAARELGDIILEHFTDPDGGFFDTSNDHEQLLLRPKELQDGAVPSGGSMAADVLVRLAEYTGERRYAEQAEAALVPLQGTMGQVPLGMARWLSVLDLVMSPPALLALVGTDVDPLLEVVSRPYLPDVLLAASSDPEGSPVPVLHGKSDFDGEPAAYLCVGHVCEQPVTEARELEELLELAAPSTC